MQTRKIKSTIIRKILKIEKKRKLKIQKNTKNYKKIFILHITQQTQLQTIRLVIKLKNTAKKHKIIENHKK